jgi:hypothetical protein
MDLPLARIFPLAHNRDLGLCSLAQMEEQPGIRLVKMARLKRDRANSPTN